VKALYEHSNAVARAELDALFAKHPDLTPEQRADYERLTHRIIGKLLHGPVTQLTTHAEATARPMLTAALKKLFDLDPPPSGKPDK
jgi:glutamyl-tRNA reductase